MSSFGRKRGSVWDSKEDTNHHHHSSLNSKPASYYRDKEPELVRFSAESTEARPRSRVAQNNDNSYYSEQDETRQQFNHRSGSRSNSRSRSPIYRSYDRHNKTRTQVSPLPIREFSKRGGDQSSDYGWEDQVRKSKYHTNDFREQAMKKNGVRSYDYNTDDDGVSDPRLRRHRSEWTEEKETRRRDGYGEGEFRRSSNIPCKFFAAGFCRNDKHCRFSHQQDNNFYRRDNHNHNGHNNKWNDADRLDNGKFCEMEVSRASKKFPEPKGNGSSWIDDMEMSPDWNYVAQSLKNPEKEEPSQSRVVKDNTTTNFEEKSIGKLSYGDKPMVEEPIAVQHKNYNNPVNIAPVQAFNQNTQNHNVLPYQSSSTAGGSQQVVAATTADLRLGSNLRDPENGKVYQDNHHSIVEKPVPVQNAVTREQIDQISSISASIAQFLANGQPIPQLQQALQMTSSMAVQPNQATTALQSQSNPMTNNPNQLWGPAVSASQVISNLDKSQGLVGNPKASKENGDKKTDKTSKEEEEGKKTGEDTKDAENVVNEDEDGDEDDGDDGSDEENKKEKDPKEMRAFKFALVEMVKELLKPAWKEGKMNKDGYKNIVKKVVEKVTGSMQSGNIPQTQEKIDQYLSASKPKLSKLVQAYVSKVKKN